MHQVLKQENKPLTPFEYVLVAVMLVAAVFAVWVCYQYPEPATVPEDTSYHMYDKAK